jgi:very-short-patch-repair endonuclease
MVKTRGNRHVMRAYWRYRGLKWRIYKTRAAYRKQMRMLFPSPAEVRFVELMGGRTFTFRHIKSTKNSFPLTFILSLGKILDRENVQREVRAGAMYIDFGVDSNYYKKGIECDGAKFHRDIVKEQRRDEYLYGRGWDILHIEASTIYRDPTKVQRKVLEFLSK